MTDTQASRLDLTPTPLAFGKWGGVLLQDLETAPPVLLVEIVLQAVFRQPGKGNLHYDVPFGKMTPNTCGMCYV